MISTRFFRRGLAALGLALGLSAAPVASALPIVGPFTPGYIGDLDNRAAILIGAHPDSLDVFYDVFAFSISGAAGLFGTTFDLQDLDPAFPPSDEATIQGIALLDAASNVLAVDTDGSDGFSVLTLLPGAGVYALLVSGIGGSGAGAYAGLLASERVGAVPVPGSAALVLPALLLLAPVLRRRRAA